MSFRCHAIIILLGLASTLTAQAAPDKDGPHLFILSGQSNMTGTLAKSFRESVEQVFGGDRVVVSHTGHTVQPLKNWDKDWTPPAGMEDAKKDSNGNLYILFNKDIYKSSNQGITWTIINDSFTPYSNDGLRLLIDSYGNFFIADGIGRIFKSINFGVTWQEQGDLNGGASNDPKGIAEFFQSTNIQFNSCINIFFSIHSIIIKLLSPF